MLGPELAPTIVDVRLWEDSPIGQAQNPRSYADPRGSAQDRRGAQLSFPDGPVWDSGGSRCVSGDSRGGGPSLDAMVWAAGLCPLGGRPQEDYILGLYTKHYKEISFSFTIYIYIYIRVIRGLPLDQ